MGLFQRFQSGAAPTEGLVDNIDLVTAAFLGEYDLRQGLLDLLALFVITHPDLLLGLHFDTDDVVLSRCLS